MPFDLVIGGDNTSVSREDLFSLELPAKTKTYHPVSHEKFITEIENQMSKHLPTWEIVKEKFVTSKSGQRMFGKLLYEDTSGEMDSHMMWGLRNGYDKLTSIAFGTGKGVYVCSNMCISGSDVTVVRRHTSGVWDYVPEQIEMVASSARTRLVDIEKEVTMFKETEVSVDEGYKFLGLLLGHNILKPRLLTKALKHWVDPPFEEFEPRNAWSLYNSCTWALGTSRSVNTLLGAHQKVHTKILELVPVA